MLTRRSTLQFISLLGAAAATGVPINALAAPLTKVDPKEPQASSLGYVDDSTTVDNKKYPKHDVSQICSKCQFYQTAQESGSIAPCTIFGGKAVAAKGWCSAYVPKT